MIRIIQAIALFVTFLAVAGPLHAEDVKPVTIPPLISGNVPDSIKPQHLPISDVYIYSHNSQGEGVPIALKLEVASTPQQREKGLMFRDALAPNRGMLFVFEEIKPRSFWMRNTKISLDIIYVGEDNKIAKIYSGTAPYSLEPLPSGVPVRAVIEISAGQASALGIRVGDIVDYDAILALE